MKYRTTFDARWAESRTAVSEATRTFVISDSTALRRRRQLHELGFISTGSLRDYRCSDDKGSSSVEGQADNSKGDDFNCWSPLTKRQSKQVCSLALSLTIHHTSTSALLCPAWPTVSCVLHLICLSVVEWLCKWITASPCNIGSCSECENPIGLCRNQNQFWNAECRPP